MAHTTEILCCRVSKGWESESEGSAELVSLEASVLGSQMAVSSLSLHVGFPVCVSLCPNFLLFPGYQSWCVRAHLNDFIVP